MRVFKNNWFDKFAEKKGIDDKKLLSVVSDISEGRADADLGGGVYKQRLEREGKGKSGSYRVVLFFKKGELCFFVYAFEKSDFGNISNKELKNLKKLAKVRLALTNEQLDDKVKNGELKEIL